ncbi:hypothetical protein N7495_005861 [Penicillium taxi]|uniref:uncharacterized protein n=1 Tax=Penicillium taxi TaxID=168475 RepID=UPI0025453411|nr:uncharacterized protein N7495_005861 [Penicillium taxi]KAJ5894170.1 hypothetical protein N7495_005861 [Penicillium taxi]
MAPEPPTVTLHPREVLRNVADALNRRHNELAVTLPINSTWVTALRAVEEAIAGVGEDIVLMLRGIRGPKVRELAVVTPSWEQACPGRTIYGQEIRTAITLSGMDLLPRRTQEMREKIREMAEKTRDEGFREPYVVLRAEVLERSIPTIHANIFLRAIDGDDESPVEVLNNMAMIFDTGAHRTIIAELLLPQSFRESLHDPIHDPYRDQHGVIVQLDIEMAFTNCALPLTTSVLIVPQAEMPNSLVGVLFGQTGGIDHLRLQMRPRNILQAKREQIPENVWGDIILDEYVDLYGAVHAL